MAKKVGGAIKAAAGVGMLGGAIAAGAVAGKVADIEAGWKRVLIALGFTGLVTTVLAVLKPTKGAAVFAGIGGAIGSLALFGQSAAARWMERAKAKKEAATSAAISVPGVMPPRVPAAVPAATVPTFIVQAPVVQREPTTLEQVSPIVTSLFENLAKMGGSIWGSGATWRRAGVGTRFARGSGTRFARATGTRFAVGQREYALSNQ